MSSSRYISIFMILSVLVHFHTLSIAQKELPHVNCENQRGNFTANSRYPDNLNRLLSSFSSNTENNYGFYNGSFGDNSDQVFARALCRGDVEPDICRACISDIAKNLQTNICPNKKEAILGYDECMVFYSNHSIFGDLVTLPGMYLWNPVIASDPAGFSATLRTLLEKSRREAAAGDAFRKFAVNHAITSDFRKVFTSDFMKVYVITECTPDLSEQECLDCLDQIIREHPTCCTGRTGGWYISPSCNFRFENSRFYYTRQPLPPAPTPTANWRPIPPAGSLDFPNGNKKNKNSTSRTAAIIVVSIASIMVLLVIGVNIFLRTRRIIRVNDDEYCDDEEIIRPESFQYDFKTIKAATNDFSDRNKLGKGGFGAVYKGKLSDRDIVVKRLFRRDLRQRDLGFFKNEVLLLARLQHQNLVRLLGFSLERKERLPFFRTRRERLLIFYEFVPNSSLDHFIFDRREQLDWQQRYNIIGGIAHGLLYIHARDDSRFPIIHGDLKASNILLDRDMKPKIADVGLTRLFERNHRSFSYTGYMAPEYALHDQFSVQSDIFSFGVLILEIVSGQRNRIFYREGDDAADLLSYAWKNLREGTTLNVIDRCLEVFWGAEIIRCIHIALLCVQENVADRPTMDTVVNMLNDNSISLPGPSQPAASFMHSIIDSNSRPFSSISPLSPSGRVIDCAGIVRGYLMLPLRSVRHCCVVSNNRKLIWNRLSRFLRNRLGFGRQNRALRI